MTDRFDTLAMIIEPVLGGLGHEYKAGKIGTKPKSRSSKNRRVHRAADYDDPAQKEAALLHALGRAGIRVRSVQTSSPKAPG